jgi:hypothetical protein
MHQHMSAFPVIHRHGPLHTLSVYPAPLESLRFCSNIHLSEHDLAQCSKDAHITASPQVQGKGHPAI